MPKQTRQIALVLLVSAIVPVYLVSHAQTPEVAKSNSDVPPSLFTAGPVEPLRDIAGSVELHLLRALNERDTTISGDLVGLDGNWVVIRVDHMNKEPRTSDFQWIPVSNIERMIQTTVHPERRASSTNQLTKP